MKSSWPVVFGFCAVVVAAFWYDARIADPASASQSAEPSQAAAVLVAGK
jgi:hypothetical protein